MSLGISAPKGRHRTLTPGASALDPMPDSLYIAASGDVVIEDTQGVTVTYSAVPTGLFPFRATKVKVGTTATVIAWNE